MGSTVEIILAEFGASRENAGDAALPANRLEPSLSSFCRQFPEASVVVYTDQDWPETDRYRVRQVRPLFDVAHDRYGHRSNDLYQAVGLMQSEADIAIAVDSDLLIVDERVRSIIPLAKRFGLAMPVNGRHIVWRDARAQCDGGPVHDESRGMGMCHCTALWALTAEHRDRFIPLLEAYRRQVVTAAVQKTGARGPLALWRAEWETGLSPYTLPVNWCITASNLHVPEPVVLHVGHAKVDEHYQELIKQWS